jgi:hypothetical protein
MGLAKEGRVVARVRVARRRRVGDMAGEVSENNEFNRGITRTLIV